MKKLFLILLLIFIVKLLFGQTSQTFRQQQMKFSRVSASYKELEKNILKDLKAKNFTDTLGHNMLIRVFKEEDQLEVWLKNKDNKEYSLYKTYEICCKSGVLGPKRKEGDYQVPEGYYYINDFNPWSSFYLSMGINYPNESDRILTTNKKAPGSAIYIHGRCISIGCMPIEDHIKELYILGVEAKSAGQSQIPVYIYPCKLTEEKLKSIVSEYPKNQDFWNNIKIGYDKFEATRQTVIYSIDAEGKYVFDK